MLINSISALMNLYQPFPSIILALLLYIFRYKFVENVTVVRLFKYRLTSTVSTTLCEIYISAIWPLDFM